MRHFRSWAAPRPPRERTKGDMDYQRRVARVGRKYIPRCRRDRPGALRLHHARRCGAEVFGNDARRGRSGTCIAPTTCNPARCARWCSNGPQHRGENPQLDRSDILRQGDGLEPCRRVTRINAPASRRSTPLTVAPWGKSLASTPVQIILVPPEVPDAASNKRVHRPEPASPPPQKNGQWPLNQPIPDAESAPPPRRRAA